MTEEDEVIRELDVHISNNLSLSLLQFPLKPVYSDNLIQIKNPSKYKPKHKKLELEIPFPMPIIHHKDEKRNIHSNSNNEALNNQTYISTNVALDVCLGAGLIKNNIMYITPIENVYQLRPSFKSLQSFRGETIENLSDDEHLDDFTDNNEKGL